jgi:hypothetical protein
MKDYQCEECGKKFSQKCNWVNHTKNKKYPCIQKNINYKNNYGVISGVISGVKINSNNYENEQNNEKNNEKNNEQNNKIINKNIIDLNGVIIKNKKKSSCRFCLKQFSRPDSLKRHLEEERCEVIKIQKQQKENIFINLLEEEKVVNQTKKELKELNTQFNSINLAINKKTIEAEQNKNNDNQMEFLMSQIKILNDKLELQKKESEIKIKESEIKIEKQQIQFQKVFQEQKTDTENRLKLMTCRYNELEKKHNDVIKTNEKLQTKMNKIVNKNKI